MIERQLQEEVRDLCRYLGLRCYHTHDSRRSEAGFPDLVIVGRGVLFRELKSETGTLTDAQQGWLADLTSAGADVGVWRPADLRTGAITGQLQTIRRPR